MLTDQELWRAAQATYIKAQASGDTSELLAAAILFGVFELRRVSSRLDVLNTTIGAVVEQLDKDHTP